MAGVGCGGKGSRSWRNPEQVSSAFQVQYWIRSLGDILNPNTDLIDIESEPFKTAGDEYWELCLSPLVVWDTEHRENAKCGRHWKRNTKGMRVCEDGSLDPKLKYIGLWLRCLSSPRSLEDKSITPDRVVRYTISLKTDSGKLIAINQDVWVPFIYSNHLRGTYWFCSHSDIINSYKKFSCPHTDSAVGVHSIDLNKKLFVCVQWEFQSSIPVPYPFVHVSSKDDSQRLVTLQLGKDRITTHEALVRCSSVLSQALDDLDKKPSPEKRYRSQLLLDDVVSSVRSGTSLQEFCDLVHAPTEYTIMGATDQTLADLLKLAFELELPSICSVVESVIRSRCKSPGTVMQFYRLLGRCMPWKMIFWTEIYLRVGNRDSSSGTSQQSPVLWLVKLGMGDDKILVKKFLECRPHLPHQVALKKALDHGSDYLLLAATRHIAFDYLRRWAYFLVGFTPNLPSEQLLPFETFPSSIPPAA